MPGILPMKVIKVGTSNQARIAQACDRCRSKVRSVPQLVRELPFSAHPQLRASLTRS